MAQTAHEQQRALARQVEDAREAGRLMVERNAAEIAQQDHQLATLQRQLTESQAALQRATQAVEAAQRLSATNEARAQELA